MTQIGKAGGRMSTPAKHTAFTPGPWAWFGNAGSNSIYLATEHGGRRFVMDFVRWGFRGAQPRFQPGKGIMVNAADLLEFEVGDRSVRGVEQAKADTSVYRLDIRGIDCPDARLIAAAPDLLAALLALMPEGWGDDDTMDHMPGVKLARLAIAKALATPVLEREG